jgi:UDP-N-acetylmuramoyl-L-alanyl-D-glutamate--2,6-diaminopimelate ligase
MRRVSPFGRPGGTDVLTTLDSAAAAVQWLAARVQGRLCSDSRAVQPGDAFIAWPGYAHDARAFVDAALAAGAAACLVEAQGVQAYAFDDARIAALPGLKAATGPIADLWFGEPSSQLQVVATTGTNGKTSTAWWMAQALTRLGRRCGVIGTLGTGEPPPAGAAAESRTLEPTGLTTPDPVTLHGTLRRFVDQGLAACAIEASSIGLNEHRLAAVRIAVAMFTNLTRDHLDYHGDMAHYWAAKRALFDWPGLRAAVVNIDDEHGAGLATELAASHLDLWSVSLRRAARLQAQGLHTTEHGLGFEIVEGAQREPVRSTLVGEFNAANLMVLLGGLRALGVPLREAAAALAHLGAVPGRLQRVAGPDAASAVEVVVDYAHTPDALSKVIKALRPLVHARGGRLWCVFGCGGKRDATKRPLMGAIATCGADHVVLTSDNPRDEAPEAILAQILAGVVGHDEVDVIEDRRQAIRHAVQQAAPGDVVLLAGKGHEEYQEVAGVRRPFSDLLEARAALALRAGDAP